MYILNFKVQETWHRSLGIPCTKVSKNTRKKISVGISLRLYYVSLLFVEEYNGLTGSPFSAVVFFVE